jgi:hypothetical protein
MVGFVALALALRALASTPAPWARRGFRRVETQAWLAAAFLLPYYGAEVFALQALGAYVARSGDVAALEVADAFRYAPVAVTTFSIGLLALAVVGVSLAIGFWRSGAVGRTGGLLVAVGAATYLPQFFGSPALRIGHGLVLGAGLLLVGLTVARMRPSSPAQVGPAVGHPSEAVPSAI